MTRLLTSALLLATLFTATTLLSGPTSVHAAVDTLYASQSCTPRGVILTLSWDQAVQPVQNWIDMSLVDNGFAPGTFKAEGMIGSTHQYDISTPLPGSTTYYVRINQNRANVPQGTGLYWDTSPTFMITTVACGGGSSAPPLLGGTSSPSIQNVTCTSSLDSASVANVNPTDRKNARINAYTGDTIRCTASASGPYNSLTWRGPNGEESSGPTFVTSAGPLRQPNVPNVINLSMNWNGNPALADINVYIVAPAIQTNCPPYYGLPYNPMLYPCGLSGPY